jgi:hypothetical protein
MLEYLVAQPFLPIICLLIAGCFLLPLARKRAKPTMPLWPSYVGAISWTLFALQDAVARLQHATLRVDFFLYGPPLLLITLVCIIRLFASFIADRRSHPQQ